ncbi:hypothetical protein LUZ63_009347 [Rhynchospora breviuscula]|uniref:Transmembrane protein n=1 Tax=Rhynchospora breviuscula TaxID=2022672 RepID=A0A9Q0CEV9_9POAL|nr:hypothetical protein LUZ63_009347 [Rhynchospora breviuscula]
MNLTRPPLHSSFLLKPTLYSHHRLNRTVVAVSNGESNATTNSEATPPPDTSTTTTTKQTKRKLKVKSRRRQRDEEEDRVLAMAASSTGRKEKEVKKKGWEEMTLAEKAVELYLGEKGALFWLNKFAYASIFIVIGGWILFRFVGPSLGLYQLESPLLAPSDLFNGK